MTSETQDLDNIELNQIYVLVDSILPFEACLYYQVLPLFIDGSRLIVGTVNPEDPGATQYVNKQLSYINYSIKFQKIESDWHRNLLSKYLSHHSGQTPAEPSPSPAKTSKGEVDQPSTVASTPSTVESPPAISGETDTELPAGQARQTAPHPEAVNEAIRDETVAMPAPAASHQKTDLRSIPVEAMGTPTTPQPGEVALPNSGQPPLQLVLDNQYQNVPDSQLRTLPPQVLMQVLLSKVMAEGIGRLFFERHAQSGRILWSRDGVLQAVVDAVSPQVFQAVINELKLLTHLSLISVSKPKQVEIERTYGRDRILLRFRVMPGSHGEEATLQVLRGTALRFYQQQQIDRLGRDALNAAQTLQGRLDEIRDRARDSLDLKLTQSETLPALMALLKQMETQVEEIVATQKAEAQQPNPEEDIALQTLNPFLPPPNEADSSPTSPSENAAPENDEDLNPFE